MQREQAPTAPSKGLRAHRPVETRLPGRWLALARVGCLAVAGLDLALFIGGLPAYVAAIAAGCRTVVCDTNQVWFRAMQNLHALGFPLAFLAWTTLVLTGLFVVVFAIVGLVLFWRKATDPTALVAAFAFLTVPITLANVTSALPAFWRLPSQAMNWLGGSALFLLLYLFPDGRFVPSFSRWLWAGIVFAFGGQIFWPFAPFHLLLQTVSLAGLAVSVAAVQLYRYVRVSTPVERQQTKWVVFGASVALTGMLLGTVLTRGFPGPFRGGIQWYVIVFGVFYLSPLLIPLSFGLAILRSRLWEIDILINRTLVYGALTASVIGCYILVVGSLGALLRTSGHLVISLLATGVVAVLFQPLRAWLQRGVNRLMYGQRDEPYAVVARLGRRLESTLAPEAGLVAIVETVAQALKLPYAAILLKQGEAYMPAAVYGSPVEGPLTLPLSYQAEPVGQLVLGPRQQGEAFTPADRHLLEDLARQAGIAVHAVRLTGDLQRSRERLVTAREEERRRLRRDLHDGLGPTLAALALKATTVSDLIPVNPAAATQLSNELYADIRATVGEIRRLVYALRPPRLDDLGLLGAIGEAARQQSQPEGLQITVEAPERMPMLPAAVEVAAYRIAQEALTNVARHAQARTCTVRLTLAGALQVEINDDGVGIPPEHHSGVGLLSMRERATELGGICVIEPNAGSGTRVCARLPIPSELQEEVNGAAARADC
jgi:signal transduction histidine kinase